MKQLTCIFNDIGMLDTNANKVLFGGDFNTKFTLWGGEVNDVKGYYLEETILEAGLVCLNDGSYTF